jgi:HSP20 family molecular chaperone IbpA
MQGEIMSDTQVTQRDESAVNRNAARAQERRATVTPPVDIVEDSKAVTLWADLPGVSKDKLDIRVHDGSLTIEGESAVPAGLNVRLSHAEVRAPFFARRFTISDDFDTSKIEANLKDGVLKLVIPRREQAQPRRIDVNVG